MSAITILCFIAALGIIVSCIPRGVDVLSPGRVFGFTWALSLGLADLKLSLFQHTWTLYGWVILLLGVVSFLAGVFVMYVIYSRTPLLSITEVRLRLQRDVHDSVEPTRFFWALVVIFALYLLGFAGEVAIVGNVPMFARFPERLRVTFGVFGLHLFVTTMLTILIFALEYFLFMPRQKSRSIAIGVVFLMTAGTFFLLLQRYSFAFWAILALGLSYYGSRKIRLRTVVIAAAVFFGLLMIIQNIRTAVYVEQYVYVVSKMKFSREYAIFSEPYMYFVMNLENVARAVERLDHYYLGFFTFDWVVALTGLKHWLSDYLNIERLPFLNSGYNTYAYQWWCYYDFGSIGVGLISLMLGAGTGYSYYRLRTRPQILTAYAYAICLVFMVTSFRENLFTRLDVVSNLGLIWFVHRYLVRKRLSAPASGRGLRTSPDTMEGSEQTF